MYGSPRLVDEGALAPDDPLADRWWHGEAALERRAGVASLGFAGLAPDPHDDDWWEAVSPEEELDGLAALTLACGAVAPAGHLSAATPGGDLAGLLELLEPAGIDDATLVEAVAAWERLAAWAHLNAATTAAELSRRASMNPDWDLPLPARTCVAGDELAMRLGWSRPAANRLVRDGRALEAELMPVADAVRAGLVDTAKMRVLTDRLTDRAYQLIWPALEQVLPHAPLRTPTQLAADVDRALLALDPEDAAYRLPAALAKRHVCHPRRLPDGMAGIWAVLPAIDAARIDGTLEATARTARALGDPRTLDQLRADTLTDLGSGAALLAGAAAAGTAIPGTAPAGSAATSGAPFEQAPVRNHGAPAEQTATGNRGAPRDQVPAGNHGASLEQAPANDHGLSDGAGDSPGADSSPPRRAPGIRIPKVRIDVTVALSTLLGLDDKPGELAGLGPIPAGQARALALGGTWRRIVADPLTGAVLDVGRSRYRPPAAIVAHVTARDGCCAGPGCGVPADRCDIDHTTEFHGTPANGSATRGTTSVDNLGPLSDRCHRLKTDGGFTLRQVEPGVFEWLTPAGLAYRVIPGDHGRTEQLPAPSPHHSGYPDEPPF
jgi:hypothetical protein